MRNMMVKDILYNIVLFGLGIIFGILARKALCVYKEYKKALKEFKDGQNDINRRYGIYGTEDISHKPRQKK
jgi:hypothetical protein